jgi:hypothetical protein
VFESVLHIVDSQQQQMSLINRSRKPNHRETPDARREKLKNQSLAGHCLASRGGEVVITLGRPNCTFEEPVTVRERLPPRVWLQFTNESTGAAVAPRVPALTRGKAR